MSFSSNKRGRQITELPSHSSSSYKLSSPTTLKAKAPTPAKAVSPVLVKAKAVSPAKAVIPAKAVEEPPNPLENLSLTAEELSVITANFTDATQTTLTTTIMPKFAAFRKANPPNHKISVTKYDKVFITSDTHADYRKLIQMLELAELIKLPSRDMGPAVSPVKLNPYSDDIYDAKFILETKWVPVNTVFIIAGDIVDGRRCAPSAEELCEVNDPRGSFEVLLHCFLYNLRIEALKKGSEILFTLGNHDYNSVILGDSLKFCSDYGHDSMWSTFYDVSKQPLTRKIEMRKQLLTPFYQNSPYFFLSLERADGRKEVGIIHASLHKVAGVDTESILGKIVSQQTEIDRGTRTLDKFFEDEQGVAAPLWERIYNTDLDRCALIQQLNYNLIVVGHCVTASGAESPVFADIYASKSLVSQALAKEARLCKETDGMGCVLLDCHTKLTKVPKLAFVDTASSEAFRSKADLNRKRIVNILALTRATSGTPFFKVETLKLDPAASEMKSPSHSLMKNTTSKPRGGKRSKRSKRSKRKTRTVKYRN